MGTDNLYRRRSNERKERKSKQLVTRAETWLIVCEGTKTEPNYFENLLKYINFKSKKKIKFVVKGTGKNTKSLVNSVDKFFDFSDELVSKVKIPYGKVFTVFDKDSFTENDFNSAIQMSKNKNYIPLWSNECIELWFILHYEFFQSNIHRDQYFNKLSKLMMVKYRKSDNHFEILGQLSKVKIAVNNSKRLYNQYSNGTTPSNKAPCTTIFKLFDEIECYLNEKVEDL